MTDLREYITHLEKVFIKKIDNNKMKLDVMATINDRTYPIVGEITALENPIKLGDEKILYSFQKEIPVEKRHPFYVQLYYVLIQNQPHIRIRYFEFEGRERIKTYSLTG